MSGGDVPDSQAAAAPADRMKVFVSYSRDDLAFADQLVMALEDLGYEPLIDRRAINPAEPWQDRLRSLLTQCDTVVFVLTKGSLDSQACGWEVGEAKALGKRMIPVLPAPVDGLEVPPDLSLLNYIHFYPEPSVPNSGFYGGQKRLDVALKQDLAWLKQLTRLTERATEWAQARPEELLLLGAPLAEAEAWAARTPKDYAVPPLVREYLNASEARQARSEAEAEALRREKEAMAQAQAAMTARVRAERRLRWMSLTSLGVGVVLTLIAVAGAYFAAVNYVDSQEARAGLLAVEADRLREQGDHVAAMRMALEGDPAALMSPVNRLLRPEGFAAARLALVRAHGGNRLQSLQKLDGMQVRTAGFAEFGFDVLLGLDDGRAVLWDAEAQKKKAEFKAHDEALNLAMISPDGRLAVTSAGYESRLWSMASGAMIAVLETQNAMDDVAFSPDGSRIVGGLLDGSAVIWDASGARITTTPPAADAIMAVAHGTTSDLVATGDGRGRLAVWKNDGRTRLSETEVCRGSVADLQFVDGDYDVLVTCGDGTLHSMDVNGEGGMSLTLPPREIAAVSVSESMSFMLTLSPEGQLNMIDTTTGKGTLLAASGSGLLAFHMDGRTGAVLGVSDTAVWIWDDGSKPESVATDDGVSALAHVPGQDAVVVGMGEGKIALVPFGAGASAENAAIALPSTHRGIVENVALSDDGRFLLTGDTGGSLALLSLVDRKPVGSKKLTSSAIEAVTLSADGSIAAAGGKRGDVTLWTPAGDTVRRLVPPTDKRLLALALSPDGARLFVSWTDKASVLSVADGKVISDFTPPQDGEWSAAAMSRSGEWFALATKSGDMQFMSLDGRILNLAAGRARIESIAIAADDETVVTQDANMNLVLWKRTERTPLMTFGMGYRSRGAISLSPDGRTVAQALDRTGFNLWRVDPTVHASAAEQVRIACAALRELGQEEFAAEDALRFPILRGASMSPCSRF